MTQERSALTQSQRDELNFDLAMEGLGAPELSGLDIENALDQLNRVNTFTPDQARQVLSLAAQKVPVWIEAAGVFRTLQILQTGPIAVLKQTREGQQSAIDQPEAAGPVSQILAKMLQAQPDLYRNLSSAIRNGDFGQPAEVLVGSLASLLPHRPDPEPDSTGELSVLALMLRDLTAYNDPLLIERIKTQLPVEWLISTSGDEVLRRYPTVRQLLEKAWSTNDPEHQELASRLLRMDPENVETFLQGIKGKEEQPGADAFDTLIKVLAIITSESQPVGSEASREAAAEVVWVELLEMDRSDPRLRPLRHRLIGKEWYWDEESVLYTLFDTFKNMGIEIGDELPFIREHEKEILNAFSRQLDRQPHIYREGLDRTAERGEFAERLQVVIAELRKVAEDFVSVDQLTASYPDELLFAALWTPAIPA